MNDLSHEVMDSPLRSAWAARIARAAIFALMAVQLVALYGPWLFNNVGTDLETSWQQVVTYAAASGWQWGRDIAWTYGPLGFAWSPVYFEPLVPQVLLVRTVLVAALAFGLLGLLARTPIFWAVPLYVLVVYAGSMLGPGLFSIIPLLAALTYFRDPGAATLRRIAPLVVASGVLALTYASSGVLSLALFLMMDLSRLLRRRIPVFIALFAGTALAASIVAGQTLSTLPDYLRAAFELISGYADAMSAKGPAWELALYLALGALAAASLVLGEVSALKDPGRRGDSGLLLASMLVYWFIMFKTGFVRHDLHSVWSWSALAIGLALYVASRDAARSSRALVAVMLCVAVVSCCVEAMLFHGGDRISFVWDRARAAFVNVPVASLAEARQLVLDTGAWQKSRQARRDAARAAVIPAYGELRIPGTVDMIGNAQGALLLQNVEFRTRPVFQDYAAYTPWLMEMNRAHLQGPRAARTILLSTETIDNRYPMMDRGLAVLDLLAHYRPLRITAGYLVLRRRDAPLDVTVATTQDGDAALGEWVDVAASDSPVILNADIRPNALGLLAKLFFRVPHVELAVRLADGTEHTHRIVPAYAREGMLLSPYIDGVVGYAAMAAGLAEATAGSRVVAFRIGAAGERGKAYFSDVLRVRLSTVRMAAEREQIPGAELRRILDRRVAASRIASSAVPRNPLLSARDTLLLAHPPSTGSLSVSSAHQLQATYAISDGAWKDGGATDGVCFRILAAGPTGERVKLHERCLRPVERPEDRGEHHVSLPLRIDNPGALVFETDCGGNCSWDWAYWKDIEVTP